MLADHLAHDAACYRAHGWIPSESHEFFQTVAGAGTWWPTSGWLDSPELCAEIAEQSETSFVRWRLFLPGRPSETLGRCAVGLLDGLGSPPSTLCMVRVELGDLLRRRLRVADPGRELLDALRRQPAH